MKDYIKTIQKKYEKEFHHILNAINQYSKIAIFRHIHPDFDALGAAHALKTFITDNYMNKEVLVLGDNHDDLTPRLFPKTNTAHNEWFNEPFLAIVLDTPNKRRIADPRFSNAELTIKIDHHPFIEGIGDIECIETNVTSTCELLATLLLSSDLKISKQCASYLYIGIVGDSGRFEYPSTSSLTFEVVSNLMERKIDLQDIYHRMYLRDQNSLRVIAHILTHYNVSKHGVAYYILTREDLENLKITTNQGKDHVNLFHFVDGIKIWCAITEDLKEHCFRVSLRSENIDIHEVGAAWGGGGHPNASGAKLHTLQDIEPFIEDLDKLIK